MDVLSYSVPGSIGVLVYSRGTVIPLHGNPSVSTAPVGQTVVSPSHNRAHTHTHTTLTHTHTTGMERTVGRGLRSTDRWCWPGFRGLGFN